MVCIHMSIRMLQKCKTMKKYIQTLNLSSRRDKNTQVIRKSLLSKLFLKQTELISCRTWGLLRKVTRTFCTPIQLARITRSSLTTVIQALVSSRIWWLMISNNSRLTFTFSSKNSWCSNTEKHKIITGMLTKLRWPLTLRTTRHRALSYTLLLINTKVIHCSTEMYTFKLKTSCSRTTRRWWKSISKDNNRIIDEEQLMHPM